MEKGYLDVVINKEKLSNNKDIFVANCASLGIASQGNTTDEAVKNIKEAINLYLEEQPQLYEELSTTIPFFSVIELDKTNKKDAKTANIVR